MNHAVHLLTAGAWIGGLIPFVMCVNRYSGNLRGEAVTAMMRFSFYGHFVVAALVLTGAVNIALHGYFDGVWMVNNGYDRKMAIEAVASGRADLVSFGRLFIANPDLVERLRKSALLNPLMGQETVYGGGAHGYTDYPTLEPSRAATEASELAPA